MKNIKTFLMVLLVGMLALTTYACSTDEPDNGDNGDNGEVETTTVWYYNSEGWDSVYAYADNDDLLGGSPGSEATEGENDWWSIDVEVNVLSNPLTITFNDGDGNEAESAYINHPNNVYVSHEGDAMTTRRAVVELYGEFFRIYFYNSEDWESINAYSWHEGGNLIGDWPGTSVEEDEDGWVYIEIPGAIEDREGLNIIFNGQLDDEDVQTDDTAIENADDIYMTVNGEMFDSKQAAEDSLDAFVPTIEVHFYNVDGAWDDVYAYVEDDEDMLGANPGTAATQEDDSNWFTLEIEYDADDEDAEPFNLVWNNGDDVELDALEVSGGGIIMTSEGEVYTDRAQAEAFIYGEPEDFERVYFYNSFEWTELNAYIWSEDLGQILGAWPGMPVTHKDDSDWVYIDIPAEIGEDHVMIIFNGEEGQTGDLVLENADDVYLTAYDEMFDSKEAAEQAVEDAEEDENGEDETPDITWDYTQVFEKDDISGSYGDGTYEGLVDWTYVHARDYDSFDIDGGGIMLRRADEPSSLSATFDEGLNDFYLEFRKAYTGASTRTYEVHIEHDGNTETYALPEFG